MPRKVLLDEDLLDHLRAQGRSIRFAAGDAYPVIVGPQQQVQDTLHTFAWRWSRRSPAGDLASIPDGYVVHHRETRSDNRGGKLELLTRRQHALKHQRDKEEDRSGLPPPGPVRRIVPSPELSLAPAPVGRKKRKMSDVERTVEQVVLAPEFPALLATFADEERPENKIPPNRWKKRMAPTAGEAALGLMWILYGGDLERLARELCLSRIELGGLQRLYKNRGPVRVVIERWQKYRRLPRGILGKHAPLGVTSPRAPTTRPPLAPGQGGP